MANVLTFMGGLIFGVFIIALTNAGKCEDCSYVTLSEQRDREGEEDCLCPAKEKEKANAVGERDILDDYAALHDNMYDRE